ncbi:MAG: helix-turn-helix domain-containing protein, partial [Terriglobales bacterium]
LENCLERAVALTDRRMLDRDDLPATIARTQIPSMAPAHAVPEVFSPSTTDLEDIERATIARVFSQVNGDKARAGKMLGISRATLYRKLKRYNIGARAEASGATTLQ